MSTSSSAAPAKEPDKHVQPFAYIEASGGTLPAGGWDSVAERARRESLAREMGRQEGEAQARAAWEKELASGKVAVAESLQAFAREREAFYLQVEGEVVQLALSIARKILHREAQLDPLLLIGMVRVALEQIEASTKVMVRVHPQHASDWRDHFARTIDTRDLPEVVEDPVLPPDRCILETQLGKTDLGLEIQLKEIEQGLLDLLAQRPKASR